MVLRIRHIFEHAREVDEICNKYLEADPVGSYGLQTRWEVCKVEITMETATEMGLKYDQLVLHLDQPLTKHCLALLNGSILDMENYIKDKEFVSTMTGRECST